MPEALATSISLTRNHIVTLQYSRLTCCPPVQCCPRKPCTLTLHLESAIRCGRAVRERQRSAARIAQATDYATGEHNSLTASAIREKTPGHFAPVQDLIRKMCREMSGWGAPRIHGELLKLGIDNSESFVPVAAVAKQRRARSGRRVLIEAKHRIVGKVAGKGFVPVPYPKSGEKVVPARSW
jgi:hypothetical protein